MFAFFKTKKKKISTENINNFNTALKVIEDFILFEEFQNAILAINEIKSKENESFKIFIDNIPEKEKKAELEKFKKKLLTLEKLKEKTDQKRIKYEIELKARKIKIEKESIKTQLKGYKIEGKFSEAIFILNSYLERNKDNLDVIKYVNSEKSILNKLIEKNKKIRENEIKKDAFLEARELIGEIQKDLQEHKKENLSFFGKFKHSLNFYGKIRKRLKEKRLMEEVHMLLEQQTETNDTIAKSKLAQIHS